MAGLNPPRPLAAEDDGDAFDCGRDSLNSWFHRRAWNDLKANVTRTSVICDATTGAIAGFVALSAAQIERAHVPKAAQSNRPDPIPVLLLGQLAVDRKQQGRGCARSLMLFALTTAVRFSKDVGCFGVLTHPLDDGMRAFYARFGFATLPFDPKRSMVIRIADLERSGFSDRAG